MRKLRLLPLALGLSLSIVAREIVIVLPNQPQAVEEMAASELAEHLQLASGTRPAIVSEGTVPACPAIYLGATRKAAQAGIDTAEMAVEQWQLQALDREILVIAGGYPRGTIYGVYEFLERTIGVVWLDEWDTFVPPIEQVTWPPDWKVTGQPSFASRSISSYWGPPVEQRERFRFRVKQNFFRNMNLLDFKSRYKPETGEAWKRGARRMFGLPWFNHTYYHYTKDVPDEDEDIFSYSASTGKRVRSQNGAGPGQICYANPKTVEWFSSKLRGFIERDRKGFSRNEWPIYYSLTTNDNRNECECQGCRELVARYGSHCGAQLHFTNQVARAIAGDYPEAAICFDVYGKGTAVPRDIVPEPNVLPSIAFGAGHNPERPRDCYRDWDAPFNQKARKLMEAWCHLTPGMRVALADDYWTDFLGKDIYPTDNTLAIARNIKLYHQLGMESAYAECKNPTTVTFYAARIWLGYRMMDHAEADPEIELARFMNAYYGNAAPFMREYMQLLQAGQDKLPLPLQDYAPAARPDMTTEFFRSAYALFECALAAAQDEPSRLARVAKEMIPLDRARIELRHRHLDSLLPSIEIALRRYEQEYTRVCRKYERADICQRNLEQLRLFIEGVNAKIPELEDFNPSAVIADWAWPSLLGGFYNNPRIADSQAVGGYAMAMLRDTGENKGIVFGVYSNVTLQYITRNCSIPPEAVPQDEEYHWYSLGRFTLEPICFVYLHWRWTLRKALDSAYRDPQAYANNVAIYVHLKVQGPNYVKGSNNPNKYLVDRVVICRADLDWPHPLHADLPPELTGRKILAELSGTSLRQNKEPDPTSVIRCAWRVPIGKIELEGSSDKAVALEPVTIKTDKSYHLYRLGTAILTNQAQLRFDNAILPLKDYWNENTQSQASEIFISLRRKNDQFLLVERIFLVQPKKS